MVLSIGVNHCIGVYNDKREICGVFQGNTLLFLGGKRMNEKMNAAEIFGENVFDESVMEAYLPKKIFQQLKRTIERGESLEPSLADIVAEAMKNWAVEKGATHYSHWFQPLTGITAEKHDSFVSPPKNGKILLEFSGKELVKGESDASSFPSGGLRATFEARGYTAWDCTSPAFIREGAAGATLCIPTAFCSYNGESLDMKTPLLRSMEAINKEGLRLLRLFGNTNSERVTPSVGVEQEYFIVDRKKYEERKDLIYTRRTLFGAMPPKGQEMDDHYFGSIRERIGGFMKDFNAELWKMGVPAKTQHNEVAPAQHEFASIYEPANIAVDHNQLVMETIRKVSHRHGLKCLLHEKPFAGVNGSGKHNNWSLTTDDGINLFEPGEKPHENKQFLLIICCVLKAIDEHADLLRESAACVGNEHRLGADEAPPAIISVFLGEQLEDVLEQLRCNGEATTCLSGADFDSKATAISKFRMDATDRNRTSPFAFTGNKFEFRMCGSSDTVAAANIVLNTITAQAFREVCDRLESADNFEEELNQVIVELCTKHKRILFDGNGYSKEWQEEAQRRGLPNLKGMVDAIPCLVTDKSIALFESFGVYSEAELRSRAEIQFETYAKQINIEALTMIDIAGKQIIPAVIDYSTQLATSILQIEKTGINASVQRTILNAVNEQLGIAHEAYSRLKDTMQEVGNYNEGREQAEFYYHHVTSKMTALRQPIDELEMLVDKKVWPMPSYGDLMFEI